MLLWKLLEVTKNDRKHHLQLSYWCVNSMYNLRRSQCNDNFPFSSKKCKH